MKLTFILLFFVFPFFTEARQTVTVFNQVNGFIELRDQAYFDRLDKIVQDLYLEHIEYYNRAVSYYDSTDYASAYFYFNRAFQFSYFSKVKVKPDDEIMQNKALYTFLSIVRTPNHTVRQVRNARELVDDLCDPKRKEIAYADYDKWKGDHKFFLK